MFDSIPDESNTKEINTSEEEQQDKDSNKEIYLDEWVKDSYTGAWFKENSYTEKIMMMT